MWRRVLLWWRRGVVFLELAHRGGFSGVHGELCVVFSLFSPHSSLNPREDFSLFLFVLSSTFPTRFRVSPFSLLDLKHQKCEQVRVFRIFSPFFFCMNFNCLQLFGVRGRLTPFETGPGGWKWAQTELDSPSCCWLVWPPVKALQTK